MQMIDFRPVQIARGLLMRYAPTSLKAKIWDKEYREGYWNRIDHTSADVVYHHIERHSRNGTILDLGCGPGNTANEIANDKYESYVGVDIAEAALAKGRRRSEQMGRSQKNTFVHGDFLTYVPTQRFDVILIREAMYHVPRGAVAPMLSRLSHYLKADGVFIVRMVLDRKTGGLHPRLTAMVDIIEAEFEVIEKQCYGSPGPTVIVFRPKS